MQANSNKISIPRSILILIGVAVTVLFIIMFKTGQTNPTNILQSFSKPIDPDPCHFGKVPPKDPNTPLVCGNRYHNTLNRDILSKTEIAKNMSILETLVAAERFYNRISAQRQAVLKNSNWINTITQLSLPMSCPHPTTNISNKWICGLHLFENRPRPQECVIYKIIDDSTENVKDCEILENLAIKTDCHIHYFSKASNKNLCKSSRVISTGNLYLTANKGKTGETFKKLIRDQGHGWVDMLFLQIPETQVEPVMLQLVANFVDIVPIGQLHLSVAYSKGKFASWLEVMEKRGFRPYHLEVSQHKNLSESDSVIFHLSFVNIRGKHLLLSGKHSESDDN